MALTGSERVSRLRPPLAGTWAQLKARILEAEHLLVQRLAGTVFLIRVASALLAFGSQILFARWMGSFEFGIYVYVWTWVLLLGQAIDLGLGTAAQRFIPEYRQRGLLALLRGFVCGAMTTAGGLGHALPYLIPEFWTATAIAAGVVVIELAAIAWVRNRYMDTPLVSATLQVVVGGLLVFATGVLIGMS